MDISVNLPYLFILLSMIVFSLTNCLQDKKQFSCDINQLDEELLKISGNLNDRRYKIPVNDQELGAYCKRRKTASKYAKEFSSKCVESGSAAKTILSVFSYTITQADKKYCGRRNSGNLKLRQSLYGIGRCVDRTMKPNDKCVNAFLDKMNLTNGVTPDKDKFQYMCCIADEMRQCVMDAITKDSECGETMALEFASYYEQVQGNLFNVGCENFEDQIDRCHRLIQKQTKDKGTLPKVNWKTAFPVVIDVFNNL